MANISDIPRPKIGPDTVEITLNELIVFADLLVSLETEKNISTVTNLKLLKVANIYQGIIERIEKRDGLLVKSYQRIKKLEKHIKHLEEFLASEGYEGTDK